MNTMIFKLLPLTLALAIPSVGFAQIPVTDGASIAKDTANHIETITKWANQAQQMRSQIEQMREQTNLLKGSRGMGDIFNNPELREYLPNDWQQVYDNVRNQGYAGMSGDAKSIFDESKIYDRCQGLTAGEQRLCQADAAKPSQDMALSKRAFDRADERMDQIDDLRNKINQTNDPKAIAELQARIASEQASIQNEQTRLQLYQQMAQAQDALNRERARQQSAKSLSGTGLVRDVDTSF